MDCVGCAGTGYDVEDKLPCALCELGDVLLRRDWEFCTNCEELPSEVDCDVCRNSGIIRKDRDWLAVMLDSTYTYNYTVRARDESEALTTSKALAGRNGFVLLGTVPFRSIQWN
jgi:hypothetical protein